MNKKKAAIIGAVVLGVLAVGTVTFAVTDAFQSGQSYKETLDREGEGNTAVAVVAGENIYQWEINEIRWQCANSPETKAMYGDATDEELIRMLAKRKLALAEAAKRGIALSEEEMNKIREQNAASFEYNKEENQEFLDASGLTKEQLTDELANHQIEAVVEGEWMSAVVTELIDGKIAVTDDKLQKAVDKAREAINNKTDMEPFLEAYKALYDTYLDVLLNEAEKNGQFKIL